jgi:hypothetical protein
VLQEYLDQYDQTPASEVPVKVVSTHDQWTVIAPIPTQPLCLTCHGDPATFSPELKEALAVHYPNDQATGFKAGDLRGVFWAEVPKSMDGPQTKLPNSLPLNSPSSRKIKTH